jgi:hypothetical protein
MVSDKVSRLAVCFILAPLLSFAWLFPHHLTPWQFFFQDVYCAVVFLTVFLVLLHTKGFVVDLSWPTLLLA